MTPQNDTATGNRPARLLNTPLLPGVGGLCLALFLMAWPGEIFQRLPFGGTVASAAAAGIILFGTATLAVMGRRLPASLRAMTRGLTGPVLLLAFACVQSAVHSHDTYATTGLLKQYGFYLALFLAALPLLRRPEDSAAAWRLLACSAALVAALALACAAGWLTPALAGTQEYFGRRLTEDVRFGAFVRVAAATPDFNQAILPMLLSLPAAALLFTRRGAGGGPVRFALPAVLVLLLTGGILVSFSRSGLIAVAALGAAALAWRFRAAGRRRPWRTAGLALAGVLAALALLHAGGYLEMLAFRALRGFNSPDPSYRSRLYVFGLAWKLFPDFWFLGCGLGAAPEVIGRAADPRLWMGTAIHSMPFLMLFETGILGLAGYFWFWGALFRRIWTGLLRSTDPERRRLGAVNAATAAVLFWMLAIQPFQALSLFPVLAAMLAAPCAPPETETPQTKWRPWGVALGAAALAALVAWNITQYHRTIAVVDRYAGALEAGMAAELRGDWDGAEAKYLEALDITGAAKEHPHILDPVQSIVKIKDTFALSEVGEPIKNLPYYSEAVKAADLGFLLERLPGGGLVEAPGAVALFGMARAAYGRGDFAVAVELLDTCKNSAMEAFFWPELWHSMGDARWRAGEHNRALFPWQMAADMAPDAPPRHALSPKPPFTEVLAEMDAEYQWLEAEGDGETLPRRMMLLARMGRSEVAWEKLDEVWPAGLQEEKEFWRGLLTPCDAPAPEPLQ